MSNPSVLSEYKLAGENGGPAQTVAEIVLAHMIDDEEVASLLQHEKDAREYDPDNVASLREALKRLVQLQSNICNMARRQRKDLEKLAAALRESLEAQHATTRRRCAGLLQDMVERAEAAGETASAERLREATDKLAALPYV